jgi:hypothetical protein
LLHLPHPCLIIGLLTEARRVLRLGAPLAIAEADTRDAATSASGNTYAAGKPYIEHYRLRDGTTLPTTAWRHSPATIVSCLTSAGFAVDEIRPLYLAAAASPDGPPGARTEPAALPLLLYLARAA